jgi:multiple sugar transport system permease protein
VRGESGKQSRSYWKLGLFLLLCVGALLFATPLFWTISAALKSAQEYAQAPERLIPQHPAWDNFAKAWTELPFAKFVLNTLFIAGICTLGTVLSSSLVAYGFARFRFRGSGFLFGLMLATMMLPYQVTMIPVFMIWRELRAIDTYWPLTVPSFLGSAFFIFMLRQFFMGIPKELDEAAMLDGAGYIRIWWSVILPLAKPALATVAIFSFFAQWDNFEGPLIYLNSSEKYTVSIGLRLFQDTFGSNFELVMAAALMHILPTIVIFFFAQRYFMQGIALTGLKG